MEPPMANNPLVKSHMENHHSTYRSIYGHGAIFAVFLTLGGWFPTHFRLGRLTFPSSDGDAKSWRVPSGNLT